MAIGGAAVETNLCPARNAVCVCTTRPLLLSDAVINTHLIPHHCMCGCTPSHVCNLSLQLGIYPERLKECGCKHPYINKAVRLK